MTQTAEMIDALALVGVGTASLLLLLALPVALLFGLSRLEKWATRKPEPSETTAEHLQGVA